MKNILIIDTSDNILKLALRINDKNYFVCEENTQKHVEILIPQIKHLFEIAQADVKSLNEIFVCCGPGSFTGLRIGITTAITLAFSLNIQVYGFCTFNVYEYLIPKKKLLIPLVDGKKQQFYCAFITDNFDSDDINQLYDFSYENIVDEIHKTNAENVIFAGKDVALISERLQNDNITFDWQFRKNYSPEQMLEYILSLGESHNLKYPEPIYIRKSEAEIELMNRKNTKS